jgi:hypothetical protein
MASITLRSVKGTPLTNGEVDGNFQSLNEEKIERDGSIPMSGKLTLVASSTARASTNIPTGTAPTSPSTGDVWKEGTAVKVRVDGSTTKTVAYTEDGVTGFTGSQGAIGFTGSQGSVGATGSVGFTGSRGFVGSQGVIGFTGSSGTATIPGSANQVIYKDGSNNAAGSDNFRYNGNGLAVGAISPSSTAGRIDASNDIVAFSSSDLRFKDDVRVIEGALAALKQFSAIRFTWKEDLKEHHGYEGGDYGIVAQEVRELFPEMVRVREDGYLGVRYERLVPILVAAIQELAVKIDELEKR